MAFQNLRDRGFRRFAWCGYQLATYSDERLEAFRKLVSGSGHPLSVYESRSELNTSLTTIEQSGIERIPATRVVERLSTLVVPVADQEMARVCRFIRENACRGIKVDDIIPLSPLSRRQLERRFREELGHTPHEEITAVQVRRVKQLLTETEMTLEQIAPLAGYRHKESLSAVFKRETGKTPGEYRRQNGIGSE